MRTLVAVELRRALARRLARLVALTAVAGILVSGTVALLQSDRGDRAAYERELAAAEERRRACLSGELEAGDFPRQTELEDFCRESTAPAGGDPGFNLRDLPAILEGTSGVLFVLGWLLGASFIGAEWNTGAITTTLTWEPRRVRLLVAKLIAAVVVAGGGTIFLHALLGAALIPAAVASGTTAGADTFFWRSVAEVGLRVALLSTVGALIGFSVGSIGRNTAAALGVGFAYLAIVESLVRALRPQWDQWLLTTNAVTFVTESPVPSQFPGHSAGEAAIVLLVYGAAVFFVAVMLFRIRDVT